MSFSLNTFVSHHVVDIPRGRLIRRSKLSAARCTPCHICVCCCERLLKKGKRETRFLLFTSSTPNQCSSVGWETPFVAFVCNRGHGRFCCPLTVTFTCMGWTNWMMSILFFYCIIHTYYIYIYTHCNTRSNKGICLITTMYFYWQARASRQNAFIMASAHYTMVRCWYCSLKKSQQFFHMFTNHCQCCNQINNFTKGDDRGTPLWSCTSPQRCKLSK